MRRWWAVTGLVALAVIVAHPPSADIRVLAHQAGDPAPRRFEAALDLGLMAMSVVVTWSAARFAGD